MRQGYDGLSLLDVVSKLKTSKKVAETPDLIILHCGGNDMGRLNLENIRSLIDVIINFINDDFSFKCKFVWFQIVPRSSWRYSDDLIAMNSCRRRINCYAANKIMHVNEGFYIKYDKLREVTPALFPSDGVHLSSLGNSVFVEQIAGALHAFKKGTSKCFE
ncbi:hypothetical protein DPMN_072714 [Dreissena polymorpha]|uniref:SGNH hydrolase-type esterase domain-containing protein n=1 Tax=Dreissena polymorpha TaxID=45954 RepID=A0A9D4BXT0_DREPO|nr:hypothetical protein DPMN_072714 [Dreissena polymorpha]